MVVNDFMYNEEYSSSEISGCFFFLKNSWRYRFKQKIWLKKKKMESYKNFWEYIRKWFKKL